ncbi:hypothetical protein EST92_09705 [Streptomyces sp. TM32]|uniref:hypothetical protein n=1 Tax=Streptomyces sp. TM32 TaxID=1652669 RepID=UPI001012353E|nr:hypothetical protein [Streptomyces sp. TM32]RXS84875.1 hypothetical protein EST92_09705 [Streptomyces sp. TM32]
MTRLAPDAETSPDTPTGWRQRLRTTHPTTVLRWLRAGVLSAVAVTALLYLVVTTQADRQIAAAQHTNEAIGFIKMAQNEARAADAALTSVFETGQVSLIGTGSAYSNHIARVYTNVTSAAEGNAAGKRGLTQIQFVQGQLTTCLRLADAAVRDYARTGQDGVRAAHNALTDVRQRDRGTQQPVPGTGGLTGSLDDLKATEQNALDEQRHSRWLAPAYLWPLLVGPAAVMLLLVLATGYVLARHFRRYIGLRLPLALLATTVVGIGTGTAVLSALDPQHLAEHPLVRTPVTLTLALALLATAAALTYLAYRPRLAEYRFPRS